MQDWLIHHSSFAMCPHLPLSTPLASPSCLSVCLSAPALRDEREEPLAKACDHHHHCDWCHSDCCLGDGSSFAEQARPSKVQGMVEETTKVLSVWEPTALQWDLCPKSTSQIWSLDNMTSTCATGSRNPLPNKASAC